MYVLPRTAAINATEERLQHALVATVGGGGPPVSPAQVSEYLACHYQVFTKEVHVRQFRPDDSLLIFGNAAVTSRVLLAPPPTEAKFILAFIRWRRQSRAFFSPLWFKVLLALENLPAHVWSPECVQALISSLCLSFELAP
jgi:hypothetical protein